MRARTVFLISVPAAVIVALGVAVAAAACWTPTTSTSVSGAFMTGDINDEHGRLVWIGYGQGFGVREVEISRGLVAANGVYTANSEDVGSVIDLPGIANTAPPAWAAVPIENQGWRSTCGFGWPATALSMTADPNVIVERDQWLTAEPAFDVHIGGRTLRLPTRVWWPGLITDTAVAWCMIGPPMLAPAAWRALRRRARPRRGLCAACGYDLRGISAGVCPECGAERAKESVADAVDEG